LTKIKAKLAAEPCKPDQHQRRYRADGIVWLWHREAASGNRPLRRDCQNTDGVVTVKNNLKVKATS
jgi:hypothetical protein